MSGEENKWLLWVDDDRPQRYAYEAMLIEDEGWNLEWARTVSEAASKLNGRTYHGLILDQMLPLFEAGQSVSRNDSVWGGCLLLHWMRGLEPPAEAGLAHQAAKIWSGNPAPSCANLHPLIVSAYYEDEVVSALMRASLPGENLTIEAKPVDEKALLRYISRIRAKWVSV